MLGYSDDSRKKQKQSRGNFKFGSQLGQSKPRQHIRNVSQKIGLAQSGGENKSYRTMLSSSQMILSAVALGFILYYTRTIILPLVIAFLLYNLFIPVLDCLEKYARLPRLISCLLVFIAVVALPVLLAMPLSSFFNKVIDDAHLYRDQIDSLFVFLEKAAQDIGLTFDESIWVLAVRDLPFSVYLSGMASWFVDLIVYIGLVILFFLFILASRRSPDKRSELFNEINHSISKYLALKAGISALTAISVGLILSFLGLEFALFIAILTFFLNFIPNLGSILACFLPLPMALLDYQGIEWFLAVMLLPASVQLFFGNIVEPKLQGDSLKLHPIVILLSLLIWGLVWGPAGMFVAVPLTTVAKIFIDRTPRMQWLSQLLEGNLSAAWLVDGSETASHSETSQKAEPAEVG